MPQPFLLFPVPELPSIPTLADAQSSIERALQPVFDQMRRAEAAAQRLSGATLLQALGVPFPVPDVPSFGDFPHE